MIRTLILGALLLVCNLCAAQKQTFDKWSDSKGVNVVYVSKALLQMMPQMDVGKANIADIAGKLEYIRILNCESAAKSKTIREEAVSELKKSGFTLIMDMKEGGEGNTVRIYHKEQGKNRNEFTLIVSERGMVSIINLGGNVTLNDIKKLG